MKTVRDDKIYTEHLRDRVEDEGLEYTILHYLDPKDIKDEELRDMCCTAELLMKKIYEKLGIAL